MGWAGVELTGAAKVYDDAAVCEPGLDVLDHGGVISQRLLDREVLERLKRPVVERNGRLFIYIFFLITAMQAITER